MNSNQIEIIAESSVNDENVQSSKEIRLDSIHFTICKKNEELDIFGMGNKYFSDEYKLKQIIQKINSNENN